MHADAIKTVKEPKKIEKIKKLKMQDTSDPQLSDGSNVFDRATIVSAQRYTAGVTAGTRDAAEQTAGALQPERSRNLLDEHTRSQLPENGSASQHNREDARECDAPPSTGAYTRYNLRDRNKRQRSCCEND